MRQVIEESTRAH